MNVVVIPVTPFAQNCSLIWDPATMEGALVDPGGDVEKIQQAVASHGVSIKKIIFFRFCDYFKSHVFGHSIYHCR